MSVSAVQDAILARAAQVLGAVAHYEALPASLDIEGQLGARLQKLPAVFVAFMGGAQTEATGVVVDADFVVLMVTGSASEAVRRAGKIGAIPILERLVPALHGLRVDGAGSLNFQSVANLFSPALDAKGITIYSAAYRIRLPLTLIDDPAWSLAALETLHADWVTDAPVDPDATLPLPSATAADTVTLPGARHGE